MHTHPPTRKTPNDQIPFPLFRIATMHTIYLRYHAQVGSGRSVEGNMLPSQVVDSQTLPSHVATRPHPTDPNPTRPETTCPNPIRPNTDPTDRGPTQPDHNSTRRRPDPTRFDPTPTRPTEARPLLPPTRNGDDPTQPDLTPLSIPFWHWQSILIPIHGGIFFPLPHLPHPSTSTSLMRPTK